jgi:hypothetical protein
MFRPASDTPNTRRYHILDPNTYRIMADQTLWLHDEMIDGEVAFRKGSVFANVYLAAAIVDRPGQVP